LRRFINGAVAYLEPSHLTIRQREVFLLRVTGRCRCAYEWGLRVHYFAEAAALSDEQIRATVYGGNDDAVWLPEDRLLIELADELHDSVSISDRLWTALRTAFSEEAMLQLLMMAGYYRTVAYIANGLQLPPEAGVSRPFPEAEHGRTR
jgi:alkylhydroperoxidase family enzyme